jgi:hypothetical protein
VWVEHNLERPVGQTAAVVADAAHIVEEGIVLLKTRVTAAAAADPTERARCLLTRVAEDLPASSRGTCGIYLILSICNSAPVCRP